MGRIEKTAPAATETDAAKRPFRVKIRLATRADAVALQAIYAHYVEKTTVSFEYEAPSVAEMERRVAEVEDVYPFLVCVVEGENEANGRNAEEFSLDDRGGANVEVGKNGKVCENGRNGGDVGDGKRREIGVGGAGGVERERIVGYALAHRAFERAAYSWTAETSVYVDRNWRRRGIGEALYSALIEILEAQGVRTLYAVVVAENEASVEFHRRAGYREFATFKDSGWKFDRWLDVVWLERTLGVWRDAENVEMGDEQSVGGVGAAEKEKKTTEITGIKRTSPAPLPVRPLAEFSKERLATICAAATRRLTNASDGR